MQHDVNRLSELRHESTSHDWVCCINPVHSPVIEPDLYLTAIKLRIGVPLFGESFECFRCKLKDMDIFGYHALCCAKGESTRGHNSVRDSILELVHLADPSAEIEIQNLFPDAPTLRPADIFTIAALPGRTAALDIGK